MMPLLYPLATPRSVSFVVWRTPFPVRCVPTSPRRIHCLCGGTWASESTWARHKCGIVQASGLQCAIVWRGLLRLSGVHICPPSDSGLICSGHLWATPILWHDTSKQRRQNHTLLDRIPRVKDLQCAVVVVALCFSACELPAQSCESHQHGPVRPGS